MTLRCVCQRLLEVTEFLRQTASPARRRGERDRRHLVPWETLDNFRYVNSFRLVRQEPRVRSSLCAGLLTLHRLPQPDPPALHLRWPNHKNSFAPGFSNPPFGLLALGRSQEVLCHPGKVQREGWRLLVPRLPAGASFPGHWQRFRHPSTDMERDSAQGNLLVHRTSATSVFPALVCLQILAGTTLANRQADHPIEDKGARWEDPTASRRSS